MLLLKHNIVVIILFPQTFTENGMVKGDVITSPPLAEIDSSSPYLESFSSLLSKMHNVTKTNNKKQMKKLKLTSIEGAVLQMVQGLLAATAGTASAPPLVVVVAARPCFHLLLQDHPANALRGGEEDRRVGGAEKNESIEHMEGPIRVS